MNASCGNVEIKRFNDIHDIDWNTQYRNNNERRTRFDEHEPKSRPDFRHEVFFSEVETVAHFQIAFSQETSEEAKTSRMFDLRETKLFSFLFSVSSLFGGYRTVEDDRGLTMTRPLST
jgi:hypothetical protein